MIGIIFWLLSVIQFWKYIRDNDIFIVLPQFAAQTRIFTMHNPRSQSIKFNKIIHVYLNCFLSSTLIMRSSCCRLHFREIWNSIELLRTLGKEMVLQLRNKMIHFFILLLLWFKVVLQKMFKVRTHVIIISNLLLSLALYYCFVWEINFERILLFLSFFIA